MIRHRMVRRLAPIDLALPRSASYQWPAAPGTTSGSHRADSCAPTRSRPPSGVNIRPSRMSKGKHPVHRQFQHPVAAQHDGPREDPHQRVRPEGQDDQQKQAPPATDPESTFASTSAQGKPTSTQITVTVRPSLIDFHKKRRIGARLEERLGSSPSCSASRLLARREHPKGS